MAVPCIAPAHALPDDFFLVLRGATFATVTRMTSKPHKHQGYFQPRRKWKSGDLCLTGIKTKTAPRNGRRFQTI